MPPDLDFKRLFLFFVAFGTVCGVVFGVLIAVAKHVFALPTDWQLPPVILGLLVACILRILLRQFRQGRHQWLRRSDPPPPRA